ncbi:MAG: ferrous iron transport protein A [Leptolyngbya sp. SIOISBB]|nr:ferrous iron transport protein A [Leptolyngbya sp. SIOISBB]
MKSTSDIAFGQPTWTMTFIGGSADDVESPASTLSKPINPSPGRLPLAMMTVGDRVWVVDITGGHRMVRRLADLGVMPGCEITLVSRTHSGSVVVALQGCRIGLGAGMAHRVIVTAGQSENPAQAPLTEPQLPVIGDPHMTTTTATLGGFDVGQSGRILGYEPGGRAYRSKLLSMGLTPGTRFTVTRQAPLGDPVEIEVRGFKLSLRKGEAATLQVEMLNS